MRTSKGHGGGWHSFLHVLWLDHLTSLHHDLEGCGSELAIAFSLFWVLGNTWLCSGLTPGFMLRLTPDRACGTIFGAGGQTRSTVIKVTSLFIVISLQPHCPLKEIVLPPPWLSGHTPPYSGLAPGFSLRSYSCWDTEDYMGC